MVYKGSKERIAKYLLPIILKDRRPGQYYVEPFCGGCNMIDKVDGNRIANDSNKYLIAMFEALLNGWEPPVFVTKEQYEYIKAHKEEDYKLAAWAGLICTYGASWFEGWAGSTFNTKAVKNGTAPYRVFQVERTRNLVKQLPMVLKRQVRPCLIMH